MHTQQLRREIKALRRSLSPETLRQHSARMCRLARNHRAFRHSRRIAFYHAVSGEMDPGPLLGDAFEAGKQVFLPVLRQRPANSLWFAPMKRDASMQNNRFAIPEPVFHHRHLVMPWSLDLVFVPLVAFDPAGHRVGMGGGYYDRTFAFKHQRKHLRGPRLIGLAHEFQRMDDLEHHPWDVPLDAVITESAIHEFNQPHTD
ncbi:MAG: 5-formyltetrahydrofolate cyclo-ligase [Candidatus Thiodiazotropha sp.]